jgi:HEAT repeat protein
MQLFYPMLGALIVVSTTTSAEIPTDASALADFAEQRIYIAQAQMTQVEPSAARATRKRESQATPTDDEALALAALEGLMSQPPQRALPIIKKVLAGSQSALIKQRALFVLSQIDDPEAQSILVTTTRSADPALRAEAIRNIGIGGNPESLKVLQEIYSNGDSEVKNQVLEAWLISGSKNEVYQAALNAKSDADANDAIRILGAMGATDELRKLGDAKNPSEGLAEAYAISGDLASLRKIVDGKGDVDARSDAVRKIGIVDTDAARAALREIYTTSKEAEVKDAALEGMLISGDEQGVLALYQAAQTAEDKRAVLRTLSHMEGDAALQVIEAALEAK